jgi:hypothetical protein
VPVPHNDATVTDITHLLPLIFYIKSVYALCGGLASQILPLQTARNPVGFDLENAKADKTDTERLLFKAYTLEIMPIIEF